MITTEETFRTRSLWLSSFLLLEGYRLLNFELIDPANGYFVFERGEGLDHAVATYYGGDIELPIQAYLSKYKRLRELVMKSKKNEVINGKQSIGSDR